MTLRLEAARGVERNASADPGLAALGREARPAELEKPEQLALQDFAERGRVVTFDDIDVLGTQPGGLIGAPGRLAGDVTFHPVGVAMVARHQHGCADAHGARQNAQASPRTRGNRPAQPPRRR